MSRVDVAEPRRFDANVTRLLSPRSAAIVGASETQTRAVVAANAMMERGFPVHFVNPRRETLFGRPAYARLTDIDQPVDVVLSLVNADRVPDVLEQAAAAKASGVIVVASGFNDAGEQGESRQAELVHFAHEHALPVVGPNCLGFIDVHQQAWTFAAPTPPLRSGGIGVVSQSGALLRTVMFAGHQRSLGFSKLISTGNEATLDVADYVDALVDSPETTAIALVLETVRRPGKFLAACERARAAGKPVVALRLARSARAQRIAASHTGAMISAATATDVIFEQAGIGCARDIDELVERVALFDAIPPKLWTAGRGIAVITGSGGAAGLVSDVAETEGVDLPALDELREWVMSEFPGVDTPNPLDLTAVIKAKPELVAEATHRLGTADGVDALLMLWSLNELEQTFQADVVDTFAAAANSLELPVLLSSVESSIPGRWVEQAVGKGTFVGSGVRGSLRALDEMGRFVRSMEASATAEAKVYAAALPAPTHVIDDGRGRRLPFADTMRLLEAHGVPIAPFEIVLPDDAPVVPDTIPAPYVVKLADVPHKSDVGGVIVGVTADAIPSAVEELRDIARRRGLPAAVVIQAMVGIEDEALVGIESSDYGPLVVVGLGGIYVELLKTFVMRRAPLKVSDVEALLDNIGSVGVFEGLRGAAPWSRPELARVLEAVDRFAVGSVDWLESLDVNPMVVTADGFVAVDALAIVR